MFVLLNIFFSTSSHFIPIQTNPSLLPGSQALLINYKGDKYSGDLIVLKFLPLLAPLVVFWRPSMSCPQKTVMGHQCGVKQFWPFGSPWWTSCPHSHTVGMAHISMFVGHYLGRCDCCGEAEITEHVSLHCQKYLSEKKNVRKINWISWIQELKKRNISDHLF